MTTSSANPHTNRCAVCKRARQVGDHSQCVAIAHQRNYINRCAKIRKHEKSKHRLKFK